MFRGNSGLMKKIFIFATTVASNCWMRYRTFLRKSKIYSRSVRTKQKKTSAQCATSPKTRKAIRGQPYCFVCRNRFDCVDLKHRLGEICFAVYTTLVSVIKVLFRLFNFGCCSVARFDPAGNFFPSTSSAREDGRLTKLTQILHCCSLLQAGLLSS